MKKVLLLLFICLSIILIGCNSNASKYGEDLQSVSDEILETASGVEDMLNQYSSVWSFSIQSRGAITVSDMMTQTGLDEDSITEYFQINSAGNIPDDFSTNVHSLNSYFEGTGQIEEMKNSSDDIKSKVSDLNNAPSDYEKAYDELLDMHSYFEEFIEMALNPKGNITSFNEDKNRIASDILSQHKRIETIMPSEN